VKIAAFGVNVPLLVLYPNASLTAPNVNEPSALFQLSQYKAHSDNGLALESTMLPLSPTSALQERKNVVNLRAIEPLIRAHTPPVLSA
jgi:hypothetical protein